MSRSTPLPDPLAPTTPIVVVVGERGVRTDVVAALSVGGDTDTGAAPTPTPTHVDDDPFRLRTAETAAEACRTIRAVNDDCVVGVVAVGPDAAAMADTVERAYDGSLTVVTLSTLDGREADLRRCVDHLAERWQMEQSLRNEQAFLRDALDALDDVFYVYGADCRLIRWNDRLNHVFGLDDDELAGCRPESFFVEADRDRIRTAAEEALAGSDVVVEAVAETVLGRLRFELTARRLERDGHVVGFSGVARDVTRPRKTTKQLARENETLDAFSRVLTHDLRNPLGVATGYLEQQRATQDTPELRRVARALDRIDDIINEVRSSSRESTVERSRVALADIARTAWDAVVTGDALLVVETRGAVDADPNRLQRLLENLFRNAVEHGSPDSRSGPDDDVEQAGAGRGLTVRVGAGADGFFVADDGAGFDVADPESVFKTGFSTSADGTGYGLSIVRELAAMHGWRVDATTSESGGARFDVRGVVVHDAGDDQT